jgi:hypothetical protein
MKTHLHRAPTYRHPANKERAVMFKDSERTFFISVYKYRSVYGAPVFSGDRAGCIEWLQSNGYNLKEITA